MNTLTQSQEVRQVLTLARKRHWGVRVVGDQGMISRPLYQNGWWFVPLEQDKSILPAIAKQRMDLVLKSQIPHQGFIVAHETLLRLPGKVKPKSPLITRKDVESVGKFLTKVTVVAFSLVAVTLGLLFQAMTIVDPALILVTPDGSWLILASWTEE